MTFPSAVTLQAPLQSYGHMVLLPKSPLAPHLPAKHKIPSWDGVPVRTCISQDCLDSGQKQPPSVCRASYLELHSCFPIFGFCNQNMGQVQEGANSQKTLQSALNCNQVGSQNPPAGPQLPA